MKKTFSQRAQEAVEKIAQKFFLLVQNNPQSFRRILQIAWEAGYKTGVRDSNKQTKPPKE